MLELNKYMQQADDVHAMAALKEEDLGAAHLEIEDMAKEISQGQDILDKLLAGLDVANDLHASFKDEEEITATGVKLIASQINKATQGVLEVTTEDIAVKLDSGMYKLEDSVSMEGLSAVKSFIQKIMAVIRKMIQVVGRLLRNIFNGAGRRLKQAQALRKQGIPDVRSVTVPTSSTIVPILLNQTAAVDFSVIAERSKAFASYDVMSRIHGLQDLFALFPSIETYEAEEKVNESVVSLAERLTDLYPEFEKKKWSGSEVTALSMVSPDLAGIYLTTEKGKEKSNLVIDPSFIEGQFTLTLQPIDFDSMMDVAILLYGQLDKNADKAITALEKELTEQLGRMEADGEKTYIKHVTRLISFYIGFLRDEQAYLYRVANAMLEVCRRA